MRPSIVSPVTFKGLARNYNIADKADEEAEDYVDEPDSDITAGSCQKYTTKPGAEKGSCLMSQEEDAHESGYLAQAEIFTHQPCYWRYRDVPCQPQTCGKDDCDNECFRTDENI